MLPGYLERLVDKISIKENGVSIDDLIERAKSHKDGPIEFVRGFLSRIPHEIKRVYSSSQDEFTLLVLAFWAFVFSFCTLAFGSMFMACTLLQYAIAVIG